jgi:GAF domain-containing protein
MAESLMQLPANEAERLAELRDYRILDTPPEAAFDDLARLAAQICGVPIGAVTFVDAERVWAKAQVGLAVREMPRGCSLCARAILKPGVFVVEDLAAAPEFAAYPLAGAEAGIRFFAGAPLVSPNGCAIGGLCVLDRAPRRLAAHQEEALQILGRQVITHLELRRNLRRLEQSIAGHEQTEAALREAEIKCRSIFENVNEGTVQDITERRRAEDATRSCFTIRWWSICRKTSFGRTLRARSLSSTNSSARPLGAPRMKSLAKPTSTFFRLNWPASTRPMTAG